MVFTNSKDPGVAQIRPVCLEFKGVSVYFVCWTDIQGTLGWGSARRSLASASPPCSRQEPSVCPVDPEGAGERADRPEDAPGAVLREVPC